VTQEAINDVNEVGKMTHADKWHDFSAKISHTKSDSCSTAKSEMNKTRERYNISGEASGCIAHIVSSMPLSCLTLVPTGVYGDRQYSKWG